MSSGFVFDRPFTAEERKRAEDVFRGLATYDENGEGEPFIQSYDLVNFLKGVNYYRDEEQAETYKSHWDIHFGGIVPMDKCIECCTTIHNTAAFSSVIGREWDKDGNGFIDEEEFAGFRKFMEGHYPALKDKIYTDFVQEADTDKDGLVSLEEFGVWAESVIGCCPLNWTSKK